MAITSISNLIDQIPAFDYDGRSSLIIRARTGDEGAITELAWLLEQGHWVERDLALAMKLYQWLKLNVRPTYEAEYIRLNHLLHPEMPFKLTEVRKLFKWYKEGYPEAKGAFVMALLSDKSLLEKYNDQVRDVIEMSAFQIAIGIHSDGDYRSKFWDALIALPIVVDGETALDIQPLNTVIKGVSEEAPAFVATTLLEWGIERAPTLEEGLNYQKALDCLKYQRLYETHDFYFGILCLMRLDHKTAFESFSRHESERCLLAQVYCLVNGVGVEADQEAARAILERFPKHPYGLYLSAISLYRSRKGDQVPKQVKQLLDQSAFLGYAPAKETKVVLELLESVAKGVNCVEAIKKVLDMSDDIGFSKLVHGYLHWLCVYFRDKLEQDSSFGRLAIALSMNETAIERSGFGCLAMAMSTGMELEGFNADFWRGALCKFDMSPSYVTVVLKHALALYLYIGYGDNPTLFIDYYSRFSSNDFELAILHEYAAIVRIEPGTPLRNKLFDLFARRYEKALISPLIRALVVLARSMAPDGDRDLALIREYLDQTKNTTDVLLAELRHSIIMKCDLDAEYDSKQNTLRMGQTMMEWFDNFIGYAFFNFNT